MVNMQKKANDFIVFGAPLIESEEIEAVTEVLKSGWLGTGPKVAQFENKFKEYVGSPYALAVNSCTAALHLSLLAAGVGPGDEVITTPMTFCATVNTIIHCGATPVLADIDPHTLNINPFSIISKWTPRTKAIIPVHFAGRPCDMDSIMQIAEDFNLVVIEDCAHAIETTYNGQHMGTFGDFGCFSFYSTKNICTGEGGMIVCKSKEHYERLKILSLHGMNKDAHKRFSKEGFKPYEVVEAGYKYNMMDIQAALGLIQLEKIHKFRYHREDIWLKYNHHFNNKSYSIPCELPAPIVPSAEHAYHLYTMILPDFVERQDFLNYMTENGVGVGIHYTSIVDHPYYVENYGWESKDYPHATRVGRNIVSLPISPKMNEEQVTKVIEVVLEFFRRFN